MHEMENFCRSCLVKYDDPTELLQYTEKNRRLFVYSTGLQVKKNDSFPFQLCKDCYINMKLSCQFKKQCRTSDKKFRNYQELKEIGGVPDFATFLKNYEETLKFPCLSGNSTPAVHKNKDDDNESTCTSFRNFVSDILQGEEMPDTEAHIIREVIEEETDVLDDSLDSHWLQDDISIDTDFRLDFSFSPFSTPRTVNNDRCNTPKQIEAIQLLYNDDKKTDVKSLAEETPNTTTNKKNLIPSPIIPNSEIDKPQNSEIDKHISIENNESQNSFEDLIEQNVSYFTQNENDIDLRDIGVTKNQNNNFYTLRNETEIAIKHMKIDIEKFDEQNNHVFNIKIDDGETTDVVQSGISNINKYNELISIKQSETDLAVKFIESSMNNVIESGHNVSENGNKENNESDQVSLINVNIDTFSTGNNNLVHQENKTASDFKERDSKSRDSKSDKCNKSDYDLKKDIEFPKNHETVQDIENMPKCDNINDKIEEVFQDKYGEFSLGDFMFSPSAYLAPGASTPMINNILFGETLDINEDSNKNDLNEDGGGVDVLDEILNEGVKEFGIGEQEYDLAEGYCKTCDKKFSNSKALKIHLTKRHQLRLPCLEKNRESENRPRFCEICGVTVFSNFLRHKKSHEKNKEVECTVCQLKFATEAKLKMHMKNHIAFQPVDQPPKKEFVCPVCGHMSTDPHNYAAHMRRHNQKYVATCDECGKGFYRHDDLTVHIRKNHTGQKPFHCQQCNWEFARRYDLIKHMKIHLYERPFQCESCLKTFVIRSDLVKHISQSKSCKTKRIGKMKSRGAKPNNCNYCDKKFSNKDNLIKHQNNYGPCIVKRYEMEFKRKVLNKGQTPHIQNEDMDVEFESSKYTVKEI